MTRKHDDLSGSVVGRWTLAHRAPDHGRTIYYLCRCACGVERDVALPNLSRGVSTSCGLCRGAMTPVPCPYLPKAIRCYCLSEHPLAPIYYAVWGRDRLRARHTCRSAAAAVAWLDANPDPQDCPTTAHGAPIRHSGECHTDQAVATNLN